MLSQPTISSSDDFIDEAPAPAVAPKTARNTKVSAAAVLGSKSAPGTGAVSKPRIMFYYSLQKSSLKTVIGTLLSAAQLKRLCELFGVPCFGKWMKKADLLVDHLINLKQAYQRERFNAIVKEINVMNEVDGHSQIPELPSKIDALPVLQRSLKLVKKVVRPSFPVRLSEPLQEVTGLVFLDEAYGGGSNSVGRGRGKRAKTGSEATASTAAEISSPLAPGSPFLLDLNFKIPSTVNSAARLILCLYRSEAAAASQTPLKLVPPMVLDLSLNGSLLENRSRFRGLDCYDLTLLCYKDRVNLLRILRHDTHVNLAHLVIEIVAVNLAGTLMEPTANRTVRTVDPVEMARDYLVLREEGLKLASKESFLRMLRGSDSAAAKDSSDFVELLQTAWTFSLKCPVSYRLIERPVRFSTCRHGQCFDQSTWQSLARNIISYGHTRQPSAAKFCPAVACPVCDEKAVTGVTELVECEMFQAILRAAVAARDSIDSRAAVPWEVEINLESGDFAFKTCRESDEDGASEEDDAFPTYQFEAGSAANISTSASAGAVDNDLIVIDSEPEIEPAPAAAAVDGATAYGAPGSCPSQAISID